MNYETLLLDNRRYCHADGKPPRKTERLQREPRNANWAPSEVFPGGAGPRGRAFLPVRGTRPSLPGRTSKS